MELEAGHLIGGKYRLFKPLARGGMGAIWVARHIELDVAVAIKLIASDMVLSQTAIARFRHEARAAAQLRSPHVVQILDYGIEAGVPFMAMELLSGEDLDQVLATLGRLPLVRLLEIVRPVCKALKLAHAARIVHRDLKPANIYLARVGDDEVVKVLDFGIAKALSPDAHHAQTGSATLLGSPLYMSPEQSRGDPVDGRTDLWSLAVVAFEALTGQTPFQGRGLGDIFGQICQGTTPLPSERGVDVPGLDQFFKKALAKDRDDRFASAGEFLAALEACGNAAVDAPRSAASNATEMIAAAAAPHSATGARTAQGTGTDAAISSEITRSAIVQAKPGRARSRARVWWGIAGLGGAGLAAVAWGLGLFASAPPLAPAALSEPTGQGATPASRTAEVGLALTVSPTTSASEAASASATSVEPSATALASATVAPKTRPPIATAKPALSVAPKPTATTDPQFGISPGKR